VSWLTFLLLRRVNVQIGIIQRSAPRFVDKRMFSRPRMVLMTHHDQMAERTQTVIENRQLVMLSIPFRGPAEHTLIDKARGERWMIPICTFTRRSNKKVNP